MPPETLRLELRTCVRAAGPEILRFGGHADGWAYAVAYALVVFAGRKRPNAYGQ